MRSMPRVVLALSLTLALSARADAPLESEIFDFLVCRTPSLAGAAEFFAALAADPSARQRWNASIAASPRLRARAEKGLEFRRATVEELASTFARDPFRLRLAQDPNRAALESLAALRAVPPRLVVGPIRDERARADALAEIIVRHELPTTIREADLRSHPLADWDFRRTYWRHAENRTEMNRARRQAESRAQLEAWRSSILAQIDAARTENLLRFLRFALATHGDRTLHLIPRDTGGWQPSGVPTGPRSLRLSDLVSSIWTFAHETVSERGLEPTHTMHDLPGGILIGKLTGLGYAMAQLGWDIGNLGLRLPSFGHWSQIHTALQAPGNRTTFRGHTDSTLVLRHRDPGTGAMEQVRIKHSEWLKALKVLGWRENGWTALDVAEKLVDLAGRENSLHDLNLFLVDLKPGAPDAWYAALGDRARAPATAVTPTQHLRSEPADGFGDLLEGLRWAGLSEKPDFWAARDTWASHRRPHWGPSETRAGFWASLRNGFRRLTHGWATLNPWVRTAVVYASLAAAAATPVVQHLPELASLNSWASAGAPTLEGSDSFKSTNISIEDLEALRREKLFEVSSPAGLPLTALPSVFCRARQWDGSGAVVLDASAPPTIRVRSLVAAEAGNIEIATPHAHRPTEILIWEEGRPALTPVRDFLLMHDSLGACFAKLTPEGWARHRGGRFHFQADFAKVPGAAAPLPDLLRSLPARSMADENEELRRSKISRLADSLDRLIEIQEHRGHEIHVRQAVAAFGQSALYSFRHAPYLPGPGAYGGWTYLVEGGVLRTQCQEGNRLFQVYLSRAVPGAAEHVHIQKAYVRDARSPFVTAAGRHLHNIVRSPAPMENPGEILDATPWRLEEPELAARLAGHLAGVSLEYPQQPRMETAAPESSSRGFTPLDALPPRVLRLRRPDPEAPKPGPGPDQPAERLAGLAERLARLEKAGEHLPAAHWMSEYPPGRLRLLASLIERYSLGEIPFERLWRRLGDLFPGSTLDSSAEFDLGTALDRIRHAELALLRAHQGRVRDRLTQPSSRPLASEIVVQAISELYDFISDSDWSPAPVQGCGRYLAAAAEL